MNDVIRRAATRAATVVAATALLLSGCTSTSASGPADVPTGPLPPTPASDLYRPPDPLPAGRPGQLIWATQVHGLPIQPKSRVWRLLYHSRTRTGRDIAVSGFAIVPVAAAPAEGREVYAWGHGTVGQGDACAPSKAVLDNLPPFGGEQLENGGVVVATDYDGLGTPGTPTYLDSVAEAQALLDSARAVAALPGVGRLGPLVLAGHSQGGTAALFAGQIAARYAPELKLRAVVAVAPGAELVDQATYLRSSSYAGFALIVGDGLRASYGLNPGTFLTPAAVADLPLVDKECADATVKRWSGRNPTVPTSVADIRPLADLLIANSPGRAAVPVPLLLITAGLDKQLPGALADRLQARYCALRTIVTRRGYATADHDTVIDAAHADAVTWIKDRLHGNAAPNSC